MDYENHNGVMRSGKIALYNMDCMELLRQTPDKYYSLCVVDPPYGIGECGGDKKRGRKKNHHNKIVIHEKKQWDKSIPTAGYFSELKRVSRNQIIWGGNYFTDFLPPKMGWIFWDKLIGGDFSDGELAWTSFDRALRQFTYSYHGDSHGGHWRIHPTQKPVKLYEWLLANYAKQGDKILDTHLGSGSSAIAAHYGGFDFVGCELDQDYYKAACERFHQATKQLDIFSAGTNL